MGLISSTVFPDSMYGRSYSEGNFHSIQYILHSKRTQVDKNDPDQLDYITNRFLEWVEDHSDLIRNIAMPIEDRKDDHTLHLLTPPYEHA